MKQKWVCNLRNKENFENFTVQLLCWNYHVS